MKNNIGKVAEMELFDCPICGQHIKAEFEVVVVFDLPKLATGSENTAGNMDKLLSMSGRVEISRITLNHSCPDTVPTIAS